MSCWTRRRSVVKIKLFASSCRKTTCTQSKKDFIPQILCWDNFLMFISLSLSLFYTSYIKINCTEIFYMQNWDAKNRIDNHISLKPHRSIQELHLFRKLVFFYYLFLCSIGDIVIKYFKFLSLHWFDVWPLASWTCRIDRRNFGTTKLVQNSIENLQC